MLADLDKSGETGKAARHLATLLSAVHIPETRAHVLGDHDFTPEPNNGGVFTLTLAEYLRTFEKLGYAEIRTT